jgi:hypothetical protein
MAFAGLFSTIDIAVEAKNERSMLESTETDARNWLIDIGHSQR